MAKFILNANKKNGDTDSASPYIIYYSLDVASNVATIFSIIQHLPSLHRGNS